MEPEKRVIGREAGCHVIASFLRQLLRAVSGQVTAHKVVDVVVQKCHGVLEPEEVTRGVLGGVTNKFGAEGAILRRLVGEPSCKEREISSQPVGDRPGELQILLGPRKSAGADRAVRTGGTVSCSTHPVLGRVVKHGGAEEIGVIARPVPIWRWPSVPTGAAEGAVEEEREPAICESCVSAYSVG